MEDKFIEDPKRQSEEPAPVYETDPVLSALELFELQVELWSLLVESSPPIKFKKESLVDQFFNKNFV